MPRQVVDGQNVEDAITDAGMSGGGLFGDGNLGDFTLTAYLETSGELHYNSLVIGAGGSIGVTAKQKLSLRTVENLTVDAGRSIHADGRGWSGQTGGVGGAGWGAPMVAATSPGVMVPESIGAGVAGVGGSGGGGAPAIAPNVLSSSSGGSSYASTLAPAQSILRDFYDQDMTQTEFSHILSLTQEVLNLTIPANTLLVPGDYLDFETVISNEPRNGAGNLTFVVAFGGQTILSIGGFSSTADHTTLIRGRIYYDDNGQQRCSFSFFNFGTLSGGTWEIFAPALTVSTGVSQSLTVNVNATGPVDYTSVTPLSAQVNLVTPINFNPAVAGGAGLLPNLSIGVHAVNHGTAGTVLTAAELNQAGADYAALARGQSLFGGGGAGGGAGAGFSILPTNTPGTPGSVTGVSGFGHGGDAVYNNPSDLGGSGGAGGAGGGHLVIWCGGDLTIGAGARISADGGDGGDGCYTGNSGAGEGAGAGGGGGGFVGVFYAGTLTNNGTITASGGAGGNGNTGSGQQAGNGGAGATGITVVQKVA